MLLHCWWERKLIQPLCSHYGRRYGDSLKTANKTTTHTYTKWWWPFWQMWGTSLVKYSGFFAVDSFLLSSKSFPFLKSNLDACSFSEIKYFLSICGFFFIFLIVSYAEQKFWYSPTYHLFLLWVVLLMLYLRTLLNSRWQIFYSVF